MTPSIQKSLDLNQVFTNFRSKRELDEAPKTKAIGLEPVAKAGRDEFVKTEQALAASPTPGLYTNAQGVVVHAKTAVEGGTQITDLSWNQPNVGDIHSLVLANDKGVDGLESSLTAGGGLTLSAYHYDSLHPGLSSVQYEVSPAAR